MMAYLIALLIVFVVFGIAAMGLNLVLGWGGIINLGYVGLMALGAYASAIAATAFGLPFFVGLFLAMAIGSLTAALLGILSRRLSGDALAIVLLGFTFTIYTVALNWTDLTRGSLGIPGIPRPEFIRSDLMYLVFCVLLLIAVCWILRIITRSHFGRMLGAYRDDELHTRVLGHRTFLIALATLAISGALAGLSGALLAHAIRFIDPKSFFLTQLVFVLSIVFVGGLATIRGTIVGALVMTFVPELVKFATPFSSSTVGALRDIVFSILLLGIVLYRPKGLFGTVELPSSFSERG